MNGWNKSSRGLNFRKPLLGTKREFLLGLLFFLIIFLTSCAGCENQLTRTTTRENKSTSTESILSTPIITATPMNVDISTADKLTGELSRLYPMTACRINLLAGSVGPSPMETFAPPNVEFIEVDQRTDPDMQSIIEIAENEDRSYQAFIGCDLKLCQPKVFIKNFQDRKVYEVNWDGRLPWRYIASIIWLNNDVLAYLQPNSPQVTQVLAVDVKRRDFVYYSLVYSDCPIPSITPEQ